jgi:hypothetical protein
LQIIIISAKKCSTAHQNVTTTSNYIIYNLYTGVM